MLLIWRIIYAVTKHSTTISDHHAQFRTLFTQSNRKLTIRKKKKHNIKKSTTALRSRPNKGHCVRLHKDASFARTKCNLRKIHMMHSLADTSKSHFSLVWIIFRTDDVPRHGFGLWTRTDVDSWTFQNNPEGDLFNL